jgi:hypothetical protein
MASGFNFQSNPSLQECQKHSRLISLGLCILCDLVSRHHQRSGGIAYGRKQEMYI